MSDWPADPPDFSARLRDIGSFAERFRMTGIAPDRTSQTWPLANLAIYQPFQLSEPRVIDSLYWFNGAAVNGNVDVGIYDSFGGAAGQGNLPGTLLVSAGSTAQAGTNAIQAVDVTDHALPPGMYFFALVMDGVVGTMIRVNDATLIEIVNRVANAYEKAAQFPLPATANPTGISTRDTPLLGGQFKFVPV